MTVSALVLWTFIFHGPAAFSGQSVNNLTEQACRQLKADMERVFTGHKTTLGECVVQGTAYR